MEPRRPGAGRGGEMVAIDRRAASRLRPPLVLVAAGGPAVFVALEPRDAPSVRWLVLALIGLFFAGALLAGRGRQRQRAGQFLSETLQAIAGLRRRADLPALGGALWALLVGAFAGWDGYSFARQRPGLPTLSRYLGLVTEHGWSRGLAFVAWLAWGAWAGLGWLRPEEDRPR